MNSDGFAAMRFKRDGDYLKIKYMGLSIADVLPKNERVIFYGVNYLSWMIYQEVKNYWQVCCFIDGKPWETEVDDCPVFSPDSSELRHIFTQKTVRVIVIPTWDLNSIEKTLNRISNDYILTPVECLFAAVVHKFLLQVRNPEHTWKVEDDPLLAWNKPCNAINAVFIAFTAYTLFVYMLINPDWRHTYLVTLLLNETSARELNKISVFNDVNYKLKGKYQQYINNDLLCHRNILLGEFSKRNKLPVYGHDHIPEAQYFFGTEFTLVEDGLLNYKEDTFEKWYSNMDDGEKYIQFGNNKYVGHILLTGRLPIKEEIKDKTSIVDIKKMWASKSETEKNTILSLFNFPKDRLESLVKSGRDCVLLCQNFTAAAGAKESEQVEIYRKILSHYDLRRIIIKPHPDDRLDYERYFPECEILHELFPAELILLMDIPISKIIGVTSTTLYGFFPPEKVDSYPEFFIDPFRDNIDHRGV